MQIDLPDIDKIIQVNNLKEVTNPVLCERGNIPTTDGLLSTEIFGSTMQERELTYAYVNLGGNFLHPQIYKVLKALNRNIECVINGTKEFKIENGDLIVVPDGEGNTGIEWLYKNWEKLNFKKNESKIRSERIDLLNNFKKNQLFCRNWLIMPAFYRDMNLQKRQMSHDELNDKYSKLIRLVNLVKRTAVFDFVTYSTQASIQMQLVVIYDYLKEKISHKTGIMRKALLGKTVDYCARLIITAPRFDSNKYQEAYINLDTCALPLSYCCSLFYPFMINYVKRFFERELFEKANKYPVVTKAGEVTKYIELDNPMLYFNDEEIKKQIDSFITGYQDRFRPIPIPVKNKDDIGGKTLYMAFVGRFADPSIPESVSPLLQRKLTWCDIFYQAAVEIVADKHVVITRYPVLDYFGSAIQNVHVESTQETVPMYVGGRFYQYYPKIDLEASPEAVATSFIDTLTMSNLLLKGFGGDYDGDQVTVKPIYTQEANEEATEMINRKSNIMNIEGKNMRTSSNEVIQGIYQLTRR